MSTTFKIITGLCDEMIDPTLNRHDAAQEQRDVENTMEMLNNWMSMVISQEPSDDEVGSDPTKRGELTRWIGYAFGNPRISRTEAQNTLPLLPGDPNPLFQVIDAAKREGGNVELGNSTLDVATISGIKRDEWKRPIYAKLAVMTGGDVSNMQCFVAIPESDLDNEVPETFPKRTYTDPDDQSENPSTLVHTWRTWRPVKVIEEVGYIELSDGSNYLKASEWANTPIWVNVISRVQYTQIAQISESP
jgi:hypothetical protein